MKVLFLCLLLVSLLGFSRPDSDSCAEFLTGHFPVLSEGHQLSSAAREFLGAASFEDIVHHSNGGDLSVFAKSGSNIRYSILFAEHYNSRALFMMLHYIKMLNDQNKVNAIVRFDVVVSDTNKTRLGKVANEVKKCSNYKYIKFYNRRVEKLPEKYRFNYVELNAASLVSHRALLEHGGGAAPLAATLRHLTSVLLPSGVIGLSLFCLNAHEQRIRSLAAPVSAGASRERLVDLYLRSHGLQLFAEDGVLVEYLSAGLPLASPRLSDVKAMAAAEGLVALSVAPSGFSEPFDSFDQYSVQRHWSCGVEQQAFVESALPSFRYSLYLSRKDRPSAGRTGSRAKTDLRVVDRTGTLGEMFLGASARENRPEKQQPVHFSFSHFSAPNTVVNYTLNPALARSTTLLSSRYTIDQILSDCVSYAEKVGGASSLLLANQLQHFIDTLKHLNLVTLLTG